MFTRKSKITITIIWRVMLTNENYKKQQFENQYDSHALQCSKSEEKVAPPLIQRQCLSILL